MSRQCLYYIGHLCNKSRIPSFRTRTSEIVCATHEQTVTILCRACGHRVQDSSIPNIDIRDSACHSRVDSDYIIWGLWALESRIPWFRTWTQEIVRAAAGFLPHKLPTMPLMPAKLPVGCPDECRQFVRGQSPADDRGPARLFPGHRFRGGKAQYETRHYSAWCRGWFC